MRCCTRVLRSANRVLQPFLYLCLLPSTFGLLCAENTLPDEVESVRLTLPLSTSGPPTAGKRVAVQTKEYEGTSVHHMLFLPKRWSRQAAKKYPVIVELTGNRYPKSGSTGRVEDAGLGYGISRGEFIWLTLPFVDTEQKGNALTWWDDVDATVAYAKKCVPQTCEAFHGDSSKVFLCGFSRGAIGVNFIGLHDDVIAKLWCGFISHDHFDGEREWRGTWWGSPLKTYRRGSAFNESTLDLIWYVRTGVPI